MSEILLYYKYVQIDDPKSLVASQKQFCLAHNLKGRILIAHEGINGTIEGDIADTSAYIEELTKDSRFEDISFKRSKGDGSSFPKLSIKSRNEIVSAHLGSQDLNPSKVSGKYISAKELHELIHSNKEFYIVDMRNDYEQKVGFFDNSILSDIPNFRDLPLVLQKISHLKDKKIVTVCTGGVRCEKASGFLIENGFSDVYQLNGGIVTYMSEFPNEDFLGKLYVFDKRIIMGFNTDRPGHKVVGVCERCKNKSENYINCANNLCHKHFILCTNCINEIGNAYCDECEKITTFEPN